MVVNQKVGLKPTFSVDCKHTTITKMEEYSFDLKFSLPNDSDDPFNYVEILAENGCDDAVIGIGNKGIIALSFVRSALSRKQAVDGAINDVKKAIPQGELIEISFSDEVNSIISNRTKWLNSLKEGDFVICIFSCDSLDASIGSVKSISKTKICVQFPNNTRGSFFNKIDGCRKSGSWIQPYKDF